MPNNSGHSSVSPLSTQHDFVTPFSRMSLNLTSAVTLAASDIG